MDPLGSVVECIIVLVLILLNGLLSMLEMAVVSSRKSRLEQLAEEGSKSAAYISKLAALRLSASAQAYTAAPCWRHRLKFFCVKFLLWCLTPHLYHIQRLLCW